MNGPVSALILAAGQGRRFRESGGQDKLLAPCVGLDGVERPVLEHVLKSVPAGIESRVLVTTADRPAVIGLAEAYGCRVLLVESTGMGDSLAAAVRACADASGWLVVLGDMPFVSPGTFEQIIDAMSEEGVCLPQWNGARGHPVGFGRVFGGGLMALSGDQGAKGLLRDAPVRTVVVQDSGVVWDVDVPAALIFSPQQNVLLPGAR